MMYLFVLALGAFIGWAIGSGNSKAIWAWLVAALGALAIWAESAFETVKGLL